MLQIVQLQDGCYRVVLDFISDGLTIHREWTFRVTESDAEPLEGGDQITLEFE